MVENTGLLLRGQSVWYLYPHRFVRNRDDVVSDFAAAACRLFAQPVFNQCLYNINNPITNGPYTVKHRET